MKNKLQKVEILLFWNVTVSKIYMQKSKSALTVFLKNGPFMHYVYE